MSAQSLLLVDLRGARRTNDQIRRLVFGLRTARNMYCLLDSPDGIEPRLKLYHLAQRFVNCSLPREVLPAPQGHKGLFVRHRMPCAAVLTSVDARPASSDF